MSGVGHDEISTLRAAVAEREALVHSLREVIASLEGRMAALEGALVNHANENEVLKRRLFGPRTERGGTSELQLSLGDLLKQQEQLQKRLDALVNEAKKGDATEPTSESTTPPTPRRTSRRARRPRGGAISRCRRCRA